MKRTMMALALGSALLAGSAQARIYGFAISGAATGSGQLVTSGSGPTVTVIGISGIIDGSAISGLSGFAGADDLLTISPGPGASHFDEGGISFADSTLPTAIDYNLTNYPSSTGDFITTSIIDPSGGTGQPFPSSINFTLSVPEPATWAMMLLGVGMMGAGLRMSRRKNALANLAT